jgi:hypothetical protein
MRHSIASSNMFVKSFRTKSFVKNSAQFSQNINLLLNFTKIIKNKSRGVLALKVDGVTLLTGPEKAETIAFNFSAAHNNTMSTPLEDIVEDGCSVLENNEFNLEASILTSPRESRKLLKISKIVKLQVLITFQIFFLKTSLVKLLFS